MLPALAIAGEYPYDVEKEVEDIWVIEDLDELEDLLEELDDLRRLMIPVAVDTEADDVDPKEESPAGKGSIITTQLAWIEQARIYKDEERVLGLVKTGECEVTKVWIDCRNPKMLRRLRTWLEDERAPKVLQNSKFDQHMFGNHGIIMKGLVGDTLGMSHLQYPERLSHSLDGAIGLVATLLKEKRLQLSRLLVFIRLANEVAQSNRSSTSRWGSTWRMRR